MNFTIIIFSILHFTFITNGIIELPENPKDSISTNKIIVQINKKFEYKSLKDSVFFVGDRILVSNIEFEGGRVFLNKTGLLALDSIVEFLNQNPTIIVQIENHSSSRGTSEMNLKFTELRAKNVQFGLIQKGIDSSRLLIKGFGETELIISDEEIRKLPTKNEMELAHLKNERTVLLIVKK